MPDQHDDVFDPLNDPEYGDTIAALAAGRNATWETPRPDLWDAIAAQTAPENETPSGEATKATAPVASLADHREQRATKPSRAVRAGTALLAAAACLIGGVAAGYGISQTRAPEALSPEVLAQVQLNTLDGGATLGQASATRTESGLLLDVAANLTRPEQGYLEVWLINVDGVRMISLGVLGGDEALLPITQDLLDEGYRIVDISVEQFDDKPAHSGDSLVRGELPTV